jgi:sec-independent protein translocase protein TatA
MNTFIIAGVIGPWQIVLIAVVVLLIFGGRKIPELMKGLGQGMKEFKNAVKDKPEEKEMPAKKEEKDENTKP